MAGGVDMFADDDDLEQDFAQASADKSDDLYDDVVTDRISSNGDDNLAIDLEANSDSKESTPNQSSNAANGPPSNIPIKRFQLYVGNLTWWTSDQDITDAVHDIGVNDFLDVKFFENRTNGQSKGFCVISLASESFMRMCLDRLPKKKLNGQCPVVTYPTSEAFSQFEALSETRVAPPPQSNLNRPQQSIPPPGMNNPPAFMMPPQQQLILRGRLPVPGMLGRPPMQLDPHKFGLPHQVMQGFPRNAMGNHQPLPGFLQGPKPCLMPQGMPLQHHPSAPGMFQGPSPVQGMPRPAYHGGPPQAIPNDPYAPRPDWNSLTGPQAHGMPPSAQGPPLQQQLPSASHVNPEFFQQSQHQSWHRAGQGYGSQSSFRPHGGATELGEHREQEFDEIMSRNRTVTSSAISRAVADAAEGEYGGAIETLVTAISLIKQSKISDDERCKILINSLQVTLDGIETKSYGHASRDRSHSRGPERNPKRLRRDRSRSRERGARSRENNHESEREKESRYREDQNRERNRVVGRVVPELQRDRHKQRRESFHRTSRH